LPAIGLILVAIALVWQSYAESKVKLNYFAALTVIFQKLTGKRAQSMWQ
jgi:hypothetical protein